MSKAWAVCFPLVLTLAALGPSSRAEDPLDPPADTVKSELVEKARRTLVQLDVTVEGPSEVITGLTPDDFAVHLGGRRIREFSVDRFCGAAPASPTERNANTGAQAEPGAIPSVSYLFYFDQHHLTFAGRQRSLELAHELVDNLIRDGNKATIISSGGQMRTFARLTDDRSVLHEALVTLEIDTEQFDSFPMQEDGRVENVLEEFAASIEYAQLESNHDRRALKAAGGARKGFGAGGTGPNGPSMSEAEKLQRAGTIDDAYRSASNHAGQVARTYQREEWWRTDRALTQLSMALGRMANFDFPKAVIYFADTMRANAGAHYLGLLGEPDLYVTGPEISGGTGAMPTGSTGSTPTTNVPSFDWVIQDAAAHGVRLYTVQAEGLIVRAPPTRLISRSMSSMGAASSASLNRRFDDAESSLVTFAMETGGQAFLKGVSADKIADEILGDMDCVYLVSFDPQGFASDRAFPVRVTVDRSDVEVRARGLLTIRSESSRLTGQLLAAFAAPEELQGSGQLVGVMIPIGFDDGKYTALAQMSIPGSLQPQVEWDVGVSVVAGSRVRETASGHISVSGQNIPVVFETVVRLAPGPWELTGVAHDSVTDEISAFRVEGDWPDPTDERATVGPIALLQPVYAVFMRDGATRRQGSLGRAHNEPIRTDLPTALVGLVCRNGSQTGPLSVERRLVGEEFVEFPDIDLTAHRDRCTVVTDVIPAGTMTAGMFQYELRVRSLEQDVASGIRELAALESKE